MVMRIKRPNGADNRLTKPGALYRYYVYAGTQPFTINANSTATDSFTINDDADFICWYITARYTDPQLRLQIRVTKTNVFNRAVDVANIAGTGAESNIIPYKTPLYFGRKETCNLDWTDYSGAENKVSLTFVGYEIVK